MRKQKLYIETSVWNFLLAEDAPEKKRATKMLFDEIEQGKHEIYISDAVTLEINLAPTEKKRQLLNEIEKYKPEMLEDTVEARRLALSYIEHGILTTKHIADLTHIAIATVNDLDVVVSWNMKHIVKMTTRIKSRAVNQLMGYHEIEICAPYEVIEEWSDEDE